MLVLESGCHLKFASRNIFLSKRSVLFRKELVWAYGIAATVNENEPVSEVAVSFNEVLQHTDGTLTLSFLINGMPPYWNSAQQL